MLIWKIIPEFMELVKVFLMVNGMFIDITFNLQLSRVKVCPSLL